MLKCIPLGDVLNSPHLQVNILCDSARNMKPEWQDFSSFKNWFHYTPSWFGLIMSRKLSCWSRLFGCWETIWYTLKATSVQAFSKYLSLFLSLPHSPLQDQFELLHRWWILATTGRKFLFGMDGLHGEVNKIGMVLFYFSKILCKINQIIAS